MRRVNDAPRLTVDGVPVTQGFGLGGFAQQSLIHQNQLVKINRAVPFPQAALLGCGVVTGAGAVLNSADVQAGDAVVVIGVGGVGLNAISGAVVAGATTFVAVDIADVKLEKAREFGATHTVNSMQGDPVAAVRDLTGGGANAVFDVVGAPAVTHQALEMTGVGGGVYLIGATSPEHGFDRKNIATVVAQQRIQGVMMGSSNPRRDIPMYAVLYLAGRFNLDGLVSREISLSEVNEGYEALHDPATTRVVITDLA